MFVPFKLTPVTVFMLGLALIIYYMQQKIPELIEPHLFISQYMNIGLTEIYNGQYWRLVSPAFLHFGLIHITINAFFLLYLGQIIEWRFGSIPFLFIFLVLAVISNLAQYITSGPAFGGLSGVVYGTVGFVWVQGEINGKFLIRLPRQFIIMILILFAISWFNPLAFLGVHIANTAHAAGLIGGIILAFLFYLLKIRCREINLG